MDYQQFGKMSIYKMLFITFALLTTLVGCQEDNTLTPAGKGKGRLALSVVTVDVTATDGIATTRAGNATYTAPDATLLTYTITNKDKEEIAYQKTGALTDLVLECGNYTLEAEYGENKMGTTPYLYATTDFTISLATTTTLSNFTVGLACAIIRPILSDDVLKQFSGGITLSLTDDAEPTQTATLTGSADYFVPTGGSYTLKMSGTNAANESKEFILKTFSNVEAKKRYILNCNPALPTLTMPEQYTYDAWGSKIYINPLTASNVGNASESTKTVIANQVKYQILKNNTWVDATSENGRPVFSGLSGNTTYNIKAVFNGIESNTAPVTTEQQTEVPNGDFEELVQTINIQNMNQGGTWTITRGGTKYQTSLSLTISEPTKWSSINLKTCNESVNNKNSWYVIPSTFNTTLSWVSHQPTAKVWGIGQNAYNSTADTYKNLYPKSNNNAMVIRNVAWDANGVTIESKSQTGNSNHSNYFCSNTPSSISNRSSGKLFLGSYSYNNGQEIYNEGITFTSRPKILNGYYKYSKDSQDTDEKGTVTILLMNGDTPIASGEIELDAANEYVQFSLPLTYTIFNLKATQLRIMITSSNRTSGIKTTNYVNKDECCSRGAELTIDNLTFEY